MKLHTLRLDLSSLELSDGLWCAVNCFPEFHKVDQLEITLIEDAAYGWEIDKSYAKGTILTGAAFIRALRSKLLKGGDKLNFDHIRIRVGRQLPFRYEW